MNRPFAALLAVCVCFIGLLGTAWLREPFSNQELLANFAKAGDYARIAASLGNFAWWTPHYLQGYSLAFASSSALTSLGLVAGAAAGGWYTGTKLAALLFLALSPLAMFAFVRRLCRDSGWPAFCCGCAYLFAPGLLLRLGHVEHISIVLAFAMIPLSFLGALQLIEDRTPRAAVLCAVFNALLVLAYAKIAVLVLPLLAGFGVWAWISRARFERPPWRLIALCLGVFALLAFLPNLPAVRESQFIARFEFGPFAGWQRSFSSNSALAWADRESWLTGSVQSLQNTIRTGGAYLGFAGLLAITALFFLRRHPLWQSAEATTVRLFLALALFAQWLAFGVHSALTGQFAFLQSSGAAPDFAIAFSWGFLVLQAAVICMIIPGSLPAKSWIAGAAIAVYLLVPGFRLIEMFPLYRDIRAPHDFFQVGGVFCFSVAAGIAAWLIVRRIPWRLAQTAVVALLLGLAPIDATLCVHSFFRSPVDRSTFDDFLAVQDFLAKSPKAGNVYPYSGRYFYLLTPLLSGRSLVAEAFNSYLAMRGAARLQQASFRTEDALKNYLNISGVTWLMIDKGDPEFPQELTDTLRKTFATVFENKNFLLVENPESLAPAFSGQRSEYLDQSKENAADRALALAAQGIVTIDDFTGISGNSPSTPARFTPISNDAFDRINPQYFRLDPPASTGWLIVPQAWHPDWQAFRQGQKVAVFQVFGGLLGLPLDGTDTPVDLRFLPPWWYYASVWACLASWIAVAGFLFAEKTGFLPPSVRTAFRRSPSRPLIKLPAWTGPESPPVERFVVVIPTYNEAAGIAQILDRSLAAHATIEILVVDDGSPDGTAGLVRAHPEFNRRIHLLERTGKLGLGSAYKAGFQWALERKYDVCLEMDADSSHDPADLPRLIAGVESGADAAIGSRYLGGVRVLNWPQDRLFLSLGASKFVRAVTQMPLTDATSGFKALRCEALRRLDWNRFVAEGYGFQVELHYFLWKSGARLVEVPITFTERREGKTKMTVGIAVEALGRVLRLAVFGR